VKGLAKRKIHWDSLEATLRKKLVLREDSETTLAPEESMAEAEAELFHVWSCFVAVNSADSSHKTMRFEHFYMLLFFIGLVASPDFENRYIPHHYPTPNLLSEHIMHAPTSFFAESHV
jgi:hypothetical protein